jgi:hypothetical protein
MGVPGVLGAGVGLGGAEMEVVPGKHGMTRMMRRRGKIRAVGGGIL